MLPRFISFPLADGIVPSYLCLRDPLLKFLLWPRDHFFSLVYGALLSIALQPSVRLLHIFLFLVSVNCVCFPNIANCLAFPLNTNKAAYVCNGNPKRMIFTSVWIRGHLFLNAYTHSGDLHFQPYVILLSLCA